MCLPNGRLTQMDNLNLAIITPHFSKIFNGESLPIDIDKIKKMIPWKETMHTLDNPITIEELQHQIYKASNEKSPGNQK